MLTLRLAAGFTGVFVLAIVVHLAMRERTAPVRCAPGLVPFAARCCGAGQALRARGCAGTAKSCGPQQRWVETPRPGCRIQMDRIALAGGVLPAGAADWQRAGDAPAPVTVAPFAIDRGEVTLARYAACVDSGACVAIAGDREPGLPVSGVAPALAERFCTFAGGRLPSAAEWRFAAGGSEGRRFPWGFTGLVCRRAAFGLVSGPCSHEGAGPDLVGARAVGATPEGVVDMAGNVAEWARDPDGTYRARGGSYRSRVAVELVTAAVEVAAPSAVHVGFRCVY